MQISKKNIELEKEHINKKEKLKKDIKLSVKELTNILIEKGILNESDLV
jgi:hypothetical protein